MVQTNIISLNQLIDMFGNFAERHYFVNDFGFGPTSDIGTSRQMQFPYIWVTLNDNSIITPQNRTSVPEISFSLLVMDKINIQSNYEDINGFNSDNQQEVLSDCLQILQDFITEVQNEWGNYGISFINPISFFPGVDDTNDKVTGVVGQFTVRLKYSNCILPTGDIAQTNLSPINPMTRYLTCETLFNCVNLTDAFAAIEEQIANIPSGTTLTGGTFDNGTLTLVNSDDSEVIVTGFTMDDIYTTGATYNQSTGEATFNRNDGNSYTLSGLFTGSTDTYVTGFTNNNNVFTISDNTGQEYSTTLTTLSGLTINGSLSATTYYGDGSNLNPAVANTGTVVHFSAGTIYNSVASPATGNITDDLTDAKIGIVQKIYHNDSTIPTFPAGWVRLGSGTYTTSTLNIIYAEWVGLSRVEYWIVKGV